MGRSARRRQHHLARKLLRIREELGLSQTQMLRRLGFEGELNYKRISEYELGTHEPPLAVLLEYARAAGVCMDVLVDDAADLPARIPGKAKHNIS